MRGKNGGSHVDRPGKLSLMALEQSTWKAWNRTSEELENVGYCWIAHISGTPVNREG